MDQLMCSDLLLTVPRLSLFFLLSYSIGIFVVIFVIFVFPAWMVHLHFALPLYELIIQVAPVSKTCA